MSNKDKYSIVIKVPCSQDEFENKVIPGLENLDEDKVFRIYIKGHTRFDIAHLSCLKDGDLYGLRVGLAGDDDVRKICKMGISFTTAVDELHKVLTTSNNYDFPGWEIIPDREYVPNKLNYVYQGKIDNKFYVFEDEYLYYKEAPHPNAFLLSKSQLAQALDLEEEKLTEAFLEKLFNKQVALRCDVIKSAPVICDNFLYNQMEDQLRGYEHKENLEIRNIAENYVHSETDFLYVEYEGCFRGYEIYAPRMALSGMETIKMLIGIHPHHEAIFELKAKSMDVIMHELNYTTMRREILRHSAIGADKDILWVAKYKAKDVLRVINSDGSSEAIPRYIYNTYSSNWRFVRGDEIADLLRFLPSVELQNEAILKARSICADTSCYIGEFDGYKVYNVHQLPPCYQFALAGILQKEGETILFDEKNELHKKIYSEVRKFLQEQRIVDINEVEPQDKDYLSTEKITIQFCKKNKLSCQASLGKWAGMTVKLAYHVNKAPQKEGSYEQNKSNIEWKYLLVSSKNVYECPECLVSQVSDEYVPFDENIEDKTVLGGNREYFLSQEEIAADEIINPYELMLAKADAYEASNGCPLVLSYLKNSYETKLSEKTANTYIETLTELEYGLTKESLRQEVVIVTKARKAFVNRYKDQCDLKLLKQIATKRFPYEGVFFNN